MPGNGFEERQEAGQPNFGGAPTSEGAIGSGLRHALKQLVNSEDPEDHRSGAQLIHAFSAQHGAYIIAARLRVLIEAAAADRDDVTRDARRRGHTIISDLLYSNLRDRVVAASQGDTAVGPNLFATYCAEYVDASLSGPGLAHTLRTATPLAERLAVLSVEKPKHRDYYCALAEVMWRHINEQVQMVAMSASKISRDERGRAIRPTPWEAADYTTARHQHMETFAEKIKQVPGVEIPERAQLEGAASPDAANRYMAYLIDALAAANHAQANVLAAYVQEAIGSLLIKTDAVRARKSWGAAMQAYEDQGDLELTVGLAQLSELRFKRAAEIARHIGDEDSESRLTFKARHHTATSPTPAPHKQTEDSQPPTA